MQSILHLLHDWHWQDCSLASQIFSFMEFYDRWLVRLGVVERLVVEEEGAGVGVA